MFDNLSTVYKHKNVQSYDVTYDQYCITDSTNNKLYMINVCSENVKYIVGRCVNEEPASLSTFHLLMT